MKRSTFALMPDTSSSTAARGQRRLITMLFCRPSGSTGLAEWMEAEHYADLLAQLSTLYEQVVPRHGGAVARIQGDGMLAIFGYPEVREDDGRRATEAALELHTLVRGLRPRPLPEHFKGLTLHSGIHAGVVFVGEGDAVRGRYELIGNAPTSRPDWPRTHGPTRSWSARRPWARRATTSRLRRAVSCTCAGGRRRLAFTLVRAVGAFAPLRGQ